MKQKLKIISTITVSLLLTLAILLSNLNRENLVVYAMDSKSVEIDNQFHSAEKHSVFKKKKFIATQLLKMIFVIIVLL